MGTTVDNCGFSPHVIIGGSTADWRMWVHQDDPAVWELSPSMTSAEAESAREEAEDVNVTRASFKAALPDGTPSAQDWYGDQDTDVQDALIIAAKDYSNAC